MKEGNDIIFEERYQQCLNSKLTNICKYKEDYYKNKGGSNWREEILNNEGRCNVYVGK